MKEHTDKAPRKSDKAVPKGRAGKSRSPKGKRAKTPGGEPPKPATAATDLGGKTEAPAEKPAASLAPDPATITFGSNRPIVAAPHKVPEGSGLRFSGPSLGELKASGPQPSSAKASGLTFTNAKNSTAMPSGTKTPGTTAAGTKTAAAKPNGAKPNGTKPNGTKPNGGSTAAAAKPESKKPLAAKGEAPEKTNGKSDGKTEGKTEGKSDAKGSESSKVPASGGKSGSTAKTPAKAPAKNAPLTKPAIAPQQSARRLEKERSSSSFVLTLFGLVVVVGGLAYWLNRGEETVVPQEQLAASQPIQAQPIQAQPTQAEPAQAEQTESDSDPARAVAGTAPEFGAGSMPEAAPPPLGRSPRAAVSPGPLAGAAPAAAPAAVLTAAEIGEIQKLLDNLGLGPGNLDGVLTPGTEAAIRAYQEMAGLPSDGVADKALLEELRSVAELYGS